MSQVAIGDWGANGAHWANTPPSDPAPARQLTSQATYGGGLANRANKGVGSGGGGGQIRGERSRLPRFCMLRFGTGRMKVIHRTTDLAL